MFLGFVLAATFIGLGFSLLKPTLDGFVQRIVPDPGGGTLGFFVSAFLNGVTVLVLLAVVGAVGSAVGIRIFAGKV